MKSSNHYISHMASTAVTSAAVLDRMHRYVNLAKAMFRKGATSNGRTFNVTFAVKKARSLPLASMTMIARWLATTEN